MANQDAEQDSNQFPALIGHSGTTEAAETRKAVVVDGALWTLSQGGTVTVEGTVATTGGGGTVVEVNNGTLSNVTITSLPDPIGSIVVTAGTMAAVTLTNPTGTTVDVANLPDLPGGTVDLVARVGNVGTLESGTVSVTFPDPVGSVVVTSGTINTGIPTATTLGDTVSNPTTPAVGVFLMGWDGLYWNRILNAQGNLDNVSAGDKGIPTHSRLFGFNGTSWDRIRGDATNGLTVNLGSNNDVSITSLPNVTVEGGTFDAGTVRVSGGTLNVGTVNVLGTIPVEEQNLDTDGYIRNSAHLYGFNSTGGTWVPAQAGSDGVLSLSLEQRTNYFEIVCVDFPIDITIGDGKAYLHIPPKLNNTDLIYVHGRVITPGTTNTTDIQIHNVTGTVDMLTTKLTIDSTETSSDTAATPYVIGTNVDDVQENDLLRIDVDAVSTTAPKGLIVTLGFQK